MPIDYEYSNYVNEDGRRFMLYQNPANNGIFPSISKNDYLKIHKLSFF